MWYFHLKSNAVYNSSAKKVTSLPIMGSRIYWFVGYYWIYWCSCRVLRHELGKIRRSCLSSVSCWHYGNILVSKMRGSNPFNDKTFLPSTTKLWRLCFNMCVSVHRGSTWAGTTPGPGTPPKDQVHPVWDQVPHPLGPGTPPGTRYTPLDRVYPPGPGTPPGTRYTPRRRLLLQTVRILLEWFLLVTEFAEFSENI